MDKMKITVRTTSPVVLSGPGNAALLTVTRDVFSGTTLRGLVAARYIAKKGLGAAAHKDADFRRLFFGGVRFVDAYPEKDGEIAFPLPASLQKKKDNSDVLDLLGASPKQGYKAFRGLGVIKGGTDLYPVSVRKNMTLHMSRNGELGGASGPDNLERLSGKSEAGRIYTYESIDEGQTFVGLLLGEKESLAALRSVLGDKWHGRAGRSKFTEYGEITCELGDIQPAYTPGPAPKGNSVRLRLQTALLPSSDETTNARTILENDVAKEMNARRGSDSFEIGSIFANAEPVDSFVAVWQLRRPRQTALSAGSCFALEKKAGAWTAEDMAALCEIMHEGVGRRVEEGFGQLRYWEDKKWRPGQATAAPQNQPPQQMKITSPIVRQKAENIVRAKRMERLRIYAAEDVKASRGSIAKQPAHVFSRLDGLLPPKNNTNMQTEFQQRLQEALRENASAFRSHLEEIKIKLPDGSEPQSLYNLLTSDLSQPYRVGGRLKDQDQLLQNFYRDIGKKEALRPEDGDLIREYWHWFFRHARKTKDGKKKEAGK